MITDLTIIGNKITINSNKDNILTDEAVPVFPVGYKLIVNGLKINNGTLDLDYTIKSSTPILTSDDLKSIANTYSTDGKINQSIKDKYGEIEYWDVSKITNMYQMFVGASNFNQNISGWDVSNVNDMNTMFAGASTFNQNISGWDVSNVNDMNTMFGGASTFNQNISGWHVSNVNTMDRMFAEASNFNQNISGWDVSNVTDMDDMFSGATVFNQNISGWDVSGVTKYQHFAVGTAMCSTESNFPLFRGSSYSC